MKILICDNIEELGEDFVEWSMGVLPEWRKGAVFKLLGTGIMHEIKEVLVKHPEINVYSMKVGEMYLSVATRKKLL